jgi:tRNA modification GTPase
VGKSSLFNALLGAPRAIVTDQPGTTRDLVGDLAEMNGIRVHLVDSAGIQKTTDIAEAEGVARARRALSIADLVLLVLDQSRVLEQADRDLLRQTQSRPRLIIVNKIDLLAAWPIARLANEGRMLSVSVKRNDGLDKIAPLVAEMLGGPGIAQDSPAITNVRHINLVKRAEAATTHALHAALGADQLSEEFLLADLQDGRAALEEITGRRTPDDVLRHIFERFCIGK